MIKNRVTVAVITRNRASSLRRTLAAIDQLEYADKEVVVVDNASTDNTKSVVGEFEVNYVFSPLQDGFSRSRQRAVDFSSGEFIAWCDDDCVPDIDWLQHFVNRFRSDEQIALLGGRVINIDFPKSLQFKGRSILLENGLLRFVENPLEAEFFGNLNMAVRSSSIQAVGGYDPFLVGGLEEIDLALTLKEHKYKITYESRAVLRHYHNHVSYKKGRWFYGGHLMRLYVWLKHRPPQNGKAFVRFLSREIIIFWHDLRILRAIASAILKFNTRKLNVSLVELFNIVSSRLSIPWLMIRARRKNLAAGK